MAHSVAFSALILASMEALARGVNLITAVALRSRAPLPHNPKQHLDTLEPLDRTYIAVNKLLTVLFVYHLLRAVWTLPSVAWKLSEITLLNTVGSLGAFFVLYDLMYASFHRFLHARAVYKYVHKHHHRQISPTRGQYDAINVHPFEFLVGEYFHLLVVVVIPCHVLAVLTFVVAGGVLASLNHTRLGFRIPGLYDVKNHDVHHRWPEQNFGQYIMLWDYVFGWYRDYAPPKLA
ncbi:hypothetical protein CTAYLR_002077 [Chrysophaeum taylorii]|uniref:Fatty acid hydroxylase domain-containing protein n=1 Tax=Chrysophaeum taylorii TaxID=2483200 RepID=A0AAD7UP99_9STRA|nr:hypothetical protein CTAYLR_002077 [Chrysophaeum taylorii]